MNYLQATTRINRNVQTPAVQLNINERSDPMSSMLAWFLTNIGGRRNPAAIPSCKHNYYVILTKYQLVFLNDNCAMKTCFDVTLCKLFVSPFSYLSTDSCFFPLALVQLLSHDGHYSATNSYLLCLKCSSAQFKYAAYVWEKNCYIFNLFIPGFQKLQWNKQLTLDLNQTIQLPNVAGCSEETPGKLLRRSALWT